MCFLLITKVLPKFSGFKPVQLVGKDELGDDVNLDDWAELIGAQATFQTCVRRFLGDDTSGQPHQPAKYRRATHWLLRALDHGLLQSTGKGLEWFVGSSAVLELLPEASARELVQRHLGEPTRGLALVAYQASTGLSGSSFCIFVLHLCMLLMADPPHRFWNSEKLGLLQGSGWEVVSLLTIVFNIGFGPWNTSSWQQSLQECIDEYVSMNSHLTCPLLAFLLPLIARDMGDPLLLLDPGFAEYTWSRLSGPSRVHLKGPHVASCSGTVGWMP